MNSTITKKRQLRFKPTVSKPGSRFERGKNLELLLMTLPVVIYIFIFHYLPMGGVILAFKNYNYVDGIFGSPWIGLKNFEYYFRSNAAVTTTMNTLLYNIAFIVIGTIISLIVALLMNEIRNKFAIKFYQTVMFFPNFLSWIVAAYILFAFLGSSYGILNQVLVKLGIETQNWYHYPKIWPFIITIMHVWKSLGMNVLLNYAVLVGIDKTYYEAAAIDGANKWHITWNISLPFLIPINVIQFILAVGRIFNADFGMFYQLTQNSGSLETTTSVIDTYVFKLLTVSNEVGIATAVGLYQSLVGLILIITTNAIVRRIQEDNALF